MATSWTQDHLDRIEAAIAEGVLEVKYQDKSVTYRSLSEMMRVRDLIRESLGQVDRNGKRTYVTHSKGT